MFEFLKKLFSQKISEPKYFTGYLPDPRSEAVRAQDPTHDELFAGPTSVVWKEKNQSQWRSFPIKNQAQSGSCVYQAVALTLGVENLLEEGVYIDLSARSGYSLRSNKPQMGAFVPEAFQRATDGVFTLESLMSSNNKGETAMNDRSDHKPSYLQIGKIYKSKGSVNIQPDIEKIASVIATGKAVGLLFRFNFPEWTSQPQYLGQVPTIGHMVSAVDYALINGKKFLIIQDSWGLDTSTINGLRMISEEYLKSRCEGGWYHLNLNNSWRDNPPEVKPKYTGTTKSLQDILRYEQLFPQTQTSTGVFGPLTKKGLIALQERYGIDQTGMVDTPTVQLLESKY